MNDPTAPQVYLERPLWKEVMIQALAGLLAGVILLVVARVLLRPAAPVAIGP